MLSTVANAVCQLLLKHVMNAFQADEVFGCMANTRMCVCMYTHFSLSLGCFGGRLAPSAYGWPSLIAAKCLQPQLHRTAASLSWKIFCSSHVLKIVTYQMAFHQNSTTFIFGSVGV